jgi:hypothetical protein
MSVRASNRTHYFSIKYPDDDEEEMTTSQLLRLLTSDGAVGGDDADDSSDSSSDDEGGALSFAAAARRRFRAGAEPASDAPEDRAAAEIERFGAMSLAARSRPTTSPLVFWSEQEHAMPTLYRLARCVLAVLSTEANAGKPPPSNTSRHQLLLTLPAHAPPCIARARVLEEWCHLVREAHEHVSGHGLRRHDLRHGA